MADAASGLTFVLDQNFAASVLHPVRRAGMHPLGRILQVSVQLEAWKRSGLTLLILDGRWGTLPNRELSRALLYWWPMMVAQAEASARGSAWTVPAIVPAPNREIRLVRPH